jgi:hypothetical protein
MRQIAVWLEKLGMSEYAQRFAANDIDIAIAEKQVLARWQHFAGGSALTRTIGNEVHGDRQEYDYALHHPLKLHRETQ